MWRPRLLLRILGGFAVLSTAATLGLGFVVIARMREAGNRDLRRRLHDEASLLRELAREGWIDAEPGTHAGRIARLSRETGSRYTLIRADGRVVEDSHHDPRQMDNHAARPEIVAALDQPPGIARRFSDTSGRMTLYVALPVPDAAAPRGIVRAAVPETHIEERVAALRRAVFGAALLALGASLALAYPVSRGLSRPVAELAAAADSVAGGSYERRVELPPVEELAWLARSFNRMSEEVRRRIDDVVRERNAVLALLGSMTEGVVAIDRDERIVRMNEAAAKILGVEVDASLGRPVWEAVRVHRLSEKLAEAARGIFTAPEEVRLAAEGAEVRCIELQATPLRETGGTAAGAVAVLHDITELRRLETLQTAFLANASHEIKTPLTAIRGFVESLLEDDAIDPHLRRKWLGRVRDQTDRLSALVGDLLTLSRLQSGAEHLEMRDLDLRPVLADCARRYDAIARHRGLALVPDIAPHDLSMRGDAEAVRQILDNLLDNAVKYTPEGGSIALRAAPADGGIVVEVRDTGIGIEPRHLDRIFERFYRVDKARSRALGGTGLGLAIVRDLVRALGGTVDVESVVGEGSRFTVRFPAAGNPRAAFTEAS